MMLAKLKVLSVATVACLVAVAGAQTYAFQYGGMGIVKAKASDKPLPKPSDQPTALIRAVDAIRAELAESARRNAELEKKVEVLAAEIEALRAGQPSAKAEPTRPDDLATAKGVKDADAKNGEIEERTAPQSTWINQGQALMVISPEGDKATVYYPATKKALSVRLSENNKTPHEVWPVDGPGLVALFMRGRGITRVAVFNEGSGVMGMGGGMAGPGDFSKSGMNVFSGSRAGIRSISASRWMRRSRSSLPERSSTSWDVVSMPLPARRNAGTSLSSPKEPSRHRSSVRTRSRARMMAISTVSTTTLASGTTWISAPSSAPRRPGRSETEASATTVRGCLVR